MNWCAAKRRLLRGLAQGGTLWPEATPFHVCDPRRSDGKRQPKLLLVVAHPDDESECAAFLYRFAHECGGIADQAIVTHGEAGFQWAAPAQKYYGHPLATHCIGRRHLPRIRRNEVLRAARILGIRRTYFFGQEDTGFTYDERVGLHAWDTSRVRDALSHQIDSEDYDLVVTLLPASDTHGHHKSVAILLLQAVAEFPQDRRPAVVGVRTGTADEVCPETYTPVPGFPLTRTTSAAPLWGFDRTAGLGGSVLDYSIIANWVIAEHKSQGLFQMEFSRRRYEHFWLFEASGRVGQARWSRCLRLFQGVRSPEDETLPDRIQAYA
jgi:LmbE family N-acetylglucosaminyl deacetylase